MGTWKRWLLGAAMAAGMIAAPMASAAGAASAEAVIRDCAKSRDGMLQREYTRAELTAALKALAGDASEYSGCYDAIKAAMAELNRGARGGDAGGGDAGGGDPGGGGDGAGDGDDGAGGAIGGSTRANGGATDGVDGAVGANRGGVGSGGASRGGADTADGRGSAGVVTVEEAGSDAPVRIAGTSVRPAISGGDHPLPTPLLALSAVLAVGALALGAVALRARRAGR